MSSIIMPASAHEREVLSVRASKELGLQHLSRFPYIVGAENGRDINFYASREEAESGIAPRATLYFDRERDTTEVFAHLF